jgi:hypothetical protein
MARLSSRVRRRNRSCREELIRDEALDFFMFWPYYYGQMLAKSTLKDTVTKRALTNEQLSRFRQSMGQQLKKIDWLASRCLFADPLIHGSPAVVYRRCGRKSCVCSTNDEKRHGPYKVIQVVRKKRSRQVCLRREQEKFWPLAEHYQYQMKRLAELKEACSQLQEFVREVIHQRTIEFPSDE